MHTFAQRTNGIDESPMSITEVDEAKESPGGAGQMLLDLAEGDPDFATPEPIVEQGIRALRSGRTHYLPSGGLPGLRESILEVLGWRNLGYTDIDEVTVTPGSKFGIFAVLAALIEPGDSVLILDPSWPSFDAMVRLAGGVPVHIEADHTTGFFPDLDMARSRINERTKAILINSPNNPTARVYGPDEVAALLDLAAERNLYVISDETYADITFSRPHVSAANADVRHRLPKEKRVVIRSFSKACAMTGWRLGYVVGDRRLMQVVRAVQRHTVTCANSVAQYAMDAALRGGAFPSVLADVVEQYRSRREVIERGFKSIELLTMAPMEGTFYSWIGIGALSSRAEEFAGGLRRDTGVTVAPGSAFGESSSGFVRLCYARAGPDALAEAVDQIAGYVADQFERT